MFLINFVVLLIFILLVLTIWWYHIYFRYKKYMKKFPIAPQIPLFGITYRARSTSDIYYMLLKYSRDLGKNVFSMLGPFPTLFTTDPKIFSLVLGSSKFVNKPPVYTCLENIVGNSLLLAKGNEWRRQRKMLNPALDYNNVLQNINIFNDQADELIKELSEKANKEYTEIDGIIEYWVLMQSYETMLGGCGTLKAKVEFLEAFKQILEIAIRRNVRLNELFNATYVFTRNFWVERKLLKLVFGHIRELIETKKTQMENGNMHQRDRPILIDILLKQMETDQNVTEAFIVKQLTLMIGASYDTTATALSYVLYNLSLNPEIQQKAYEEVFAVLGNDINQPITHQQVKDMVYLHLVIKESMRIKTPVPFFLRQLEEDVDFEGTILPKGLTIMMLPYAMHLDPELYPDPEKFIPERFFPENLNANRYSYVPFCGGIRNCIGQKYALLSMKIVLAKILLNYKLVEVKQELVLACEITLRSKTGIKVGIKKRN